MVVLSHKIRIYPTDEDIVNFKKYIGYKRYLYNKAIVVQKELYLKYKEEKEKYKDFNSLDDKEIKVCAVKFTLPSYEQRDGVMISITEGNTQQPQKYFLMKSCFVSTEPDTFTLSNNFSKVSKEMNIIEFKKLLEQIFFVW